LGRVYRKFWPRYPSIPTARRFSAAKTHEQYRTRHLRALERDPRRKLFVVINSAFFLWILTAFCIAIGGSFFSQKQKCTAEANSLYLRYGNLDDEIRSRDSHMRRAVRNAKTFSDVVKARDRYLSETSEFRGKTLPELDAALSQVLFYVDREQEASYLEDMPSSQLEYNIRQMTIPDGRKPSLNELKEDEKYFTERADRLALKKLFLIPDCSIKSVFNQLATGRSYFLTHAYLFITPPPKEK
jgi:hypothetical protein